MSKFILGCYHSLLEAFLLEHLLIWSMLHLSIILMELFLSGLLLKRVNLFVKILNFQNFILTTCLICCRLRLCWAEIRSTFFGRMSLRFSECLRCSSLYLNPSVIHCLCLNQLTLSHSKSCLSFESDSISLYQWLFH